MPLPRTTLSLFLLLGWAATLPAALSQGILTVTPGRGVTTAAGTGRVGYGGDGAAATSAQLARPSGAAYDAAGDLFFADTNNHVVREITPSGAITTIAGSGVAGFGGDGGPALAAYLDSPAAVAVDSNGNLFIADSHNHRIRKVSGGTITTVAGTGTAGFAGDGGPGANAQLALPMGLALDAAGNLFIADTNNQRVRKLSATGVLTTVAGNGEELYAGDGGPAIAASLDQPTGVAIDNTGSLYIADKNNQRVRFVSAAGVISTVAGSGAGGFSGGYSGDGTAAVNASLAKPSAVSLDNTGSLYIADTNNQRVRQIGANGVISSAAGTGDQGFAGDGGPATLAVLNDPRGITFDTNGNLLVSDTRNQRLRAGTPGKLSFSAQAIGTTSSPQSLVLSNTGTSSLTVASLSVSGPFALGTGATCPQAPFALAPGTGCTQNVAFRPTTAGLANGAVTIAGQMANSQTVLLVGSGSQGSTTLLLASNKAAALSGESVTLTASVNTSGGPAAGATGSVNFYAGTQLLGTAALAQGQAVFTTTALAVGAQTLNATYSGGPGFGSSVSNNLPEAVADVSLALASSTGLSLAPGRSASLPLTLLSTGVNGLTGNVAITAGALPGGLSVVFSPATVALSNGNSGFTMTVSAPSSNVTAAAALPLSGALLFGVLYLLPASRRHLFGGARQRLQPLACLLLVFGAAIGCGALTGCGANNGFFGQPQQTYNVVVTATATDNTGGALTRTTTVPVVVQ